MPEFLNDLWVYSIAYFRQWWWLLAVLTGLEDILKLFHVAWAESFIGFFSIKKPLGCTAFVFVVFLAGFNVWQEQRHAIHPTPTCDSLVSLLSPAETSIANTVTHPHDVPSKLDIIDKVRKTLKDDFTSVISKFSSLTNSWKDALRYPWDEGQLGRGQQWPDGHPPDLNRIATERRSAYMKQLSDTLQAYTVSAEILDKLRNDYAYFDDINILLAQPYREDFLRVVGRFQGIIGSLGLPPPGDYEALMATDAENFNLAVNRLSEWVKTTDSDAQNLRKKLEAIK